MNTLKEAREAIVEELFKNDEIRSRKFENKIMKALLSHEEKVMGRAKELWKILDDIDSLPDMIHPNTPDGHEKCWKMMVKLSEKRHEILRTDGHALTLPITDEKHE